MPFTPSYQCPNCGKRYPKTDSHRCYLDDVERHFAAKIEAAKEQWELTPRMRKRLAFEQWCFEHGRI